MVRSNDMYDAIIIGAGISGLVCGGYLAKGGMKVLVIEQHSKPGGYCTSFRRRNFLFDAAAHSFGSYRNNGQLNTIFSELGIDKHMNIKLYDPLDIVITPGFRLTFWNNVKKTVDGMTRVFPSEGESIRDYFNYVKSIDKYELLKLRNKTFDYVLQSFFQSRELMNALSLPLFGYSGLPPSSLHAFTGLTIFKDYLIDGGCYVEGGIQRLPDALETVIKENKGMILYGSLVKKILCKNKSTTGVTLDSNISLRAKYIISACDMMETFGTLLGKENVDKAILSKLRSMKPSLSAFLLYIGLDNRFKEFYPMGTNIWYLEDYNLENVYSYIEKGKFDKAGMFTVRVSPDRKTMLAYMGAPFKTPSFWRNNKEKVANTFLRNIEKIYPHIKKHIMYFGSASPQTLYKYTLNYKGAAFGWEYTPSQLFDPDFSYTPPIENLYLTGHWSTQALGISGVAYLGRNTAKRILKKERKCNLTFINV